MTLPACGLALIEHEEGCVLHPYQDEAGIWTIGIGSTRHLDGKPVTAASPNVTEEQAQLILARDAGGAWLALGRLLPNISLTQNQAGALLSLLYNIGAKNFSCSALRSSCLAIRAPALDEWTRWCLTGRPLRRSSGLFGRRTREAKLFNS